VEAIAVILRTSIGALSLVLVALFLTSAPIASADVEQLERSFSQPPEDARIMMRWWWYGPAVTKPQLEREMKLMKEAGRMAGRSSRIPKAPAESRARR
jgi:hypothetical protein